MEFDSVQSLQAQLESHLYISDPGLATAVFLAIKLQRPLFLEGEAGVGKTELAKVLARVLETELIRMQCYEGIDVGQAVYEWNYSRQMLHIRLAEAAGRVPAEADLYGPDFLLKRPLLQAIDPDGSRAPVLLIDEIDRSDDEFEAYLLEVLSEYQLSIPEIGTVRARFIPAVVLTSNRTRDVHDALKRRCLYHWIDYPDAAKELRIVCARVPDAPQRLARQVTGFVRQLRQADLDKRPGVAETLDWVRALVALDCRLLDLTAVERTLGAVLKTQEDLARISGDAARRMLQRSVAAGKQDPPA